MCLNRKYRGIKLQIEKLTEGIFTCQIIITNLQNIFNPATIKPSLESEII
jgi:hypothetical protein